MAETAGPTLVELRVLDGANLYFPRPAIKLTLDAPGLLSLPEARRRPLRHQPHPDQLRARVVAARAG
jgi:hypothetical protein